MRSMNFLNVIFIVLTTIGSVLFDSWLVVHTIGAFDQLVIFGLVNILLGLVVTLLHERMHQLAAIICNVPVKITYERKGISVSWLCEVDGWVPKRAMIFVSLGPFIFGFIIPLILIAGSIPRDGILLSLGFLYWSFMLTVFSDFTAMWDAFRANGKYLKEVVSKNPDGTSSIRFEGLEELPASED